MTIDAAVEGPGPMLLRLKVSIEGSEPVIWRLLEVDASLTLDRMHEVLQVAVGWRNSHLHSFTDTDPYKRLRPVDGALRAPLEDSGGINGYHDLVDALADPGHDQHEDLKAWVAWTAGPWQEFDPEHLDIDAVNNELALLFPAPPAKEPSSGSQSLTQELTNRLPEEMRREFRSYLNGAGLDEPELVEADVAEAMVTPYLWLVRRIGPDGITLTAAGWLPPSVVQQAMTALGWSDRWIGKANREDQTLPILRLRESAQHLGLVRKIKGRLILTSAAKRLFDDTTGLWIFLARALAHRHRHDSERDAALLLLLEVATGQRTNWDDCLDVVSFGLGALGWRTHAGTEIEPAAVHALLSEPRDVLLHLGVLDTRGLTANTIGPQGKAFARAALHS